jgi:redox-sensitive bicupin YhaK (pirin superfamily)
MEIVTWVLSGSLFIRTRRAHRRHLFQPGAAHDRWNRIRHSEKNDQPAVSRDAGQPLDLVQMWVVPDEPEVAPGYEQLELDPSDIQGRLAVVAPGMTWHRVQAAIRMPQPLRRPPCRATGTRRKRHRP